MKIKIISLFVAFIAAIAVSEANSSEELQQLPNCDTSYIISPDGKIVALICCGEPGDKKICRIEEDPID